MSIKNHFNKIKKIGVIGSFVMGLIFGIIVSNLYIQPKLIYQGKSAKDWADIAASNEQFLNIEADARSACQLDPSSKKCNQFNRSTEERNCSDSVITAADIVWHYKNCPSPTQQVIYKTQYVQAPAQETSNTSLRCYSDQLGGQFCNSNTVERIHCTPNLVGGMNCR